MAKPLALIDLTAETTADQLRTLGHAMGEIIFRDESVSYEHIVNEIGAETRFPDEVNLILHTVLERAFKNSEHVDIGEIVDALDKEADVLDKANGIMTDDLSKLNQKERWMESSNWILRR